MAAALYALTHPLAPVAWWAINTPEVTNAVAGALGFDGDGPGRRLQTTYYNYDTQQWEEVNTVSEEDYRWVVYIALAVSILVPIVMWVIEGIIYKKGVTDKRGPLGEIPAEASMNGKDFKYGLCSCCDDCQYLMHGWFCFHVRAADTFTVVGASTFWCVACAFLGTWLAAQLIGFGIQFFVVESGAIPLEMQRNNRINNNLGSLSWFIADAVLAVWLAGLRRKLRERLGDTTAGSKFGVDCLTYWCCSCCNIVQDARQIDLAQGVKVECCCKLIKTGPPMQPVQVGGAVVVGNVVG